MKRTMTLTIALVLSVVMLSLIKSDSTNAAPPQRFEWDTGAVTLGPNQILRIAADPNDPTGTPFVRFGRTTYTQNGCNADGVCKLTGTDTFTGPVSMMANEAASFDISPSGAAVRGLVVSNTRDLRVSASIIDTVTGETKAGLIALLVP